MYYSLEFSQKNNSRLDFDEKKRLNYLFIDCFRQNEILSAWSSKKHITWHDQWSCILHTGLELGIWNIECQSLVNPQNSRAKQNIIHIVKLPKLPKLAGARNYCLKTPAPLAPVLNQALTYNVIHPSRLFWRQARFTVSLPFTCNHIPVVA